MVHEASESGGFPWFAQQSGLDCQADGWSPRFAIIAASKSSVIPRSPINSEHGIFSFAPVRRRWPAKLQSCSGP